MQAVMAPEESWELPGWRCSATASGSIGRVSSASAVPWPAASASASEGEQGRLAARPASVAEIADSYRERGHRPRLRLTPLAPPGVLAEAAALGWTESGATLVMSRSLPLPAAETDAFRPRGAATWSAQASSSWRAVHLAGHQGADSDERLALALAARGATAYFEVATAAGGEVAAVGLGIVTDGLLGVYDVLTLQEHRRAGHARHVLIGLLSWGAEAGAREAYLQVASLNAPAVALYRELGFEVAYGYSYAAPPA